MTSLDAVGVMDYNENMDPLNLSLPTELQAYVDARVAAEGFSDSAAFLRDLIRRDQDEHAADIRRVQALIQEGIDSGIVDAEPEDILDEIIADLHRRHG